MTKKSKVEINEVIQYFNQIEAIVDLSKDTEYVEYEAVEKFPRGKSGASRVLDPNQVLLLANHFELSIPQTKKLYKSLFHLKEIYSINVVWEHLPSEEAVRRKLAEVRKSMERVASFPISSTRKPQSGSNKSLSNRAKLPPSGIGPIVREADRWAATQDVETLKRYGIKKRYYGKLLSDHFGINYNTSSVIQGWFEFSQLILKFTKAAMENLKRADGKQSAPTVKLAGYELPALYETITGHKFLVSNVTQPAAQHAVRGVREVRGVKFVVMALTAMGLPALKAETIVSHRKKYLKQLLYGGEEIKKN